MTTREMEEQVEATAETFGVLLGRMTAICGFTDPETLLEVVQSNLLRGLESGFVTERLRILDGMPS